MTIVSREADRKSRASACGALALLGLGTAAAVVAAAHAFPAHLVAALMLLAGAVIAIDGLLHRAPRRLIEFSIAVLLAGVSAVLLAGTIELIADLAAIVLLGGGILLARATFKPKQNLPPAQAPKAAVMFWNPASGGGKALQAGLAQEAASRRIRPVELKAGDDLEALVLAAIEGGADGLAAAGGDGTQAIVAALAAENDLPFACIPAGTRNHFALDLGVDRTDVVGALDAFVDGGEKRVDLGEVNGRIFVNNVSLGLYAEAVQQDGYRDAKLRTLLDAAPDATGPEGSGMALKWTDESGGGEEDAAAVLVSNNRYRVGHLLGSGTRPSLAEGLLGVTVFGGSGDGRPGALVRRPWREWTTSVLELEGDEAVPAGIDGEATMLDAPIRFRVRPGALRVRVASHHPAASPSAVLPNRLIDIPLALWRTASGRSS